MHDEGQQAEFAPVDGAGELQGAADNADDERDHEKRRRKEPHGRLPWVPAHEFASPDSGGEELAGQFAPVFARPVGDFQLRIKPHGVAGFADAEVEFPVFAAAEGFVVAAHFCQYVALEHPEVGRFCRAFCPAAVVAGAAEAEFAVVCAGDSGLEGRFAAGDHDAANVGCACSGECFDRSGRVAGSEF